MEKMPFLISLIFTYLTIIVITNSFNLIDGVDGLAGSLGLFTTLAFGLLFLDGATTFLRCDVVLYGGKYGCFSHF